MNWYKKAQQYIYRGDTEPISMQDYDTEYGTREFGRKLDTSGIYFTTNEEDAQSFGQHITKADIQNANILTESDNTFTTDQISQILKGIDKEKTGMAISNWDEDYNIGLGLLIESIVNEKNPIDQLMNIWANVFYHQNSNDFMTLMTRNGIDGIAMLRTGSTHFVI